LSCKKVLYRHVQRLCSRCLAKQPVPLDFKNDFPQLLGPDGDFLTGAFLYDIHIANSGLAKLGIAVPTFALSAVWELLQGLLAIHQGKAFLQEVRGKKSTPLNLWKSTEGAVCHVSQTSEGLNKQRCICHLGSYRLGIVIFIGSTEGGGVGNAQETGPSRIFDFIAERQDARLTFAFCRINQASAAQDGLRRNVHTANAGATETRIVSQSSAQGSRHPSLSVRTAPQDVTQRAWPLGPRVWSGQPSQEATPVGPQESFGPPPQGARPVRLRDWTGPPTQGAHALGPGQDPGQPTQGPDHFDPGEWIEGLAQEAFLRDPGEGFGQPTQGGASFCRGQLTQGGVPLGTPGSWVSPLPHGVQPSGAAQYVALPGAVQQVHSSDAQARQSGFQGAHSAKISPEGARGAQTIRKSPHGTYCEALVDGTSPPGCVPRRHLHDGAKRGLSESPMGTKHKGLPLGGQAQGPVRSPGGTVPLAGHAQSPAKGTLPSGLLPRLSPQGGVQKIKTIDPLPMRRKGAGRGRKGMQAGGPGDGSDKPAGTAQVSPIKQVCRTTGCQSRRVTRGRCRRHALDLKLGLSHLAMCLLSSRYAAPLVSSALDTYRKQMGT
jgi:hypothetical protein